MKRGLAALLALMLLLFTACGRETPETPEEPEQPVVTDPEEPDVPEEPGGPEEPDSQDEPDVPEEPGDTDTQQPPADGDVVTQNEYEGDAGQVRYTGRVPTFHTGSEDVDQILNQYYSVQWQKIVERAAGELSEQAEAEGTTLLVEADYTVERCDEEILSICRTVSVTNGGGGTETTRYGETFALDSGGLLTAGDFFAVEPTEYGQRLADCVRRQIREDPYHSEHYFAQWEELAATELDQNRFYVTSDAYCVFYPEGALGWEAKTVFEIPWSQLADILA